MFMISYRPKWLAFDVYATLVNREEGGVRAFSEILRKHGDASSPAEIFQEWHRATIRTYRSRFMKYKQAALRGLTEVYSTHGIQGEPRADLQIFFDSMERWEAFSDVKPVLSKLGKRFGLAAVTNMDTDLFERTKIGIKFDVAVTSEMARAYKPHPRVFRYALRKMGCTSREVLCVGTTPWADIVGARLSGLRVAWINRRSPSCFQGQELDPWTPRPDFEFKDLHGLLSLFM